jgi:hypothetical protein
MWYTIPKINSEQNVMSMVSLHDLWPECGGGMQEEGKANGEFKCKYKKVS